MGAKKWQEAIREFVCGVVSSTYRSIRAEQLAELLNLPSKDLDAVVKANGWKRSKDDKEVIIVRENATFENARAEPKTSTTMSLDTYRQLFMASSGHEGTEHYESALKWSDRVGNPSNAASMSF